MNMTDWLKALTLVALALAALAASAARAEVEIVPLRHRTADQVIAVLRPLVEQGGALSGMQNQLVIRASPKNIAELRKVLEAIDIAQRHLMIYVRQDSAGASRGSGAEVSATTTMGGARVVISNERGNALTEGGVRARVYDSRSASEERLVQQVQALEGTSALIQIGQSIPVTNRTMAATPAGGVIVADNISYRDVTTGFEVIARVSGDRVTLEISPRRDTPGADGGVGIQRIHSTAGGMLGEWFELGGMAQDESRQHAGLVAGTSALRQDNRRVWVKVEEIR
jgi:hypothetical protein